jgi:hypothetical protein
VKRYGKRGRKVGWIVKWYGKYGRKVSWIVCCIFHIFSLFNLLFFHNVPIFSLFNLLFFHIFHEKYSKNEQLMSHQALRKSRGSDDHCTEFCVVTCWKCCIKINIRNNRFHPLIFVFIQHLNHYFVDLLQFCHRCLR